MIGLLAATGLRIGELLALRWRSVDLEIGTLTVRESAFEGKIQPPKTLKVRRTIPLGPHAVAILTDHRTRSTRQAADDFLFPNRDGKPLRESKVLRRVLQPAAERIGIGRVRWHQFRHIQLIRELIDERVEEDRPFPSARPSRPRRSRPRRRTIPTTCDRVCHVAPAH